MRGLSTCQVCRQQARAGTSVFPVSSLESAWHPSMRVPQGFLFDSDVWKFLLPFFFFKAWGCSKCVVGLWPAAAGLDHFFSIQLKHWHTVLWNILDLCLLFQVIYLQKAELNRETVYPMHPSSIHGVEDMSTLAELHEAAIMHNLFLRYQKDNIYVRHCLNLQAHLPPWWTWNLWVLCVLQGCKGGISQTIHNINGKPLLML